MTIPVMHHRRLTHRRLTLTTILVIHHRRLAVAFHALTLLGTLFISFRLHSVVAIWLILAFLTTMGLAVVGIWHLTGIGAISAVVSFRHQEDSGISFYLVTSHGTGA